MDDTALDTSLYGDRTVEIGAAESGERLDKALASILPRLSRARLQRLIAEGQVVSGGKPLTDPARKVHSGDAITVTLPYPRPAEPEPENIALTVAHEDEHLIVIDKPAGMTVHPAPGQEIGTLVNALLHHCAGSLSGIGGVARPGIVHRIDKDTSGLLVVAKTDQAHVGLARQFENHSIERRYQAVVWGVPGEPSGTVRGNIGRNPNNRKKMAVIAKGGKSALTHWTLLQAFGKTAALVECKLETGRTHQIRVHMTHIGHPLIGDPVYGGGGRSLKKSLPPEVREAISGFSRQALHAKTLGFHHPQTNEHIKLNSVLPGDINKLIKAFKLD